MAVKRAEPISNDIQHNPLCSGFANPRLFFDKKFNSPLSYHSLSTGTDSTSLSAMLSYVPIGTSLPPLRKEDENTANSDNDRG